MNITPAFAKGIKYTLLAMLALFLFDAALSFNGSRGFSLGEPLSFSRLLLNEINSLCYHVAFWLIIGVITKERRGVLFALGLHVLFTGYMLFQYEASMDPQTFYGSAVVPRMVVSALSYLGFGWLHLRSPKALFFPLIWLVSLTSGSGQALSTFTGILDNLLSAFDLDDLLTLERNLGEGRYRQINFPRLLIPQLFFPYSIAIFWFIYGLIRSTTKLDLSLTTVKVSPGMDNLTYSVLFWAFRVCLLLACFNLLGYMAAALDQPFSLRIMFFVTGLCFGIYVMASAYRNFLVDFFINRDRFPSWACWLLNIPVINLFAWLYTLSLPKTNRASSVEVTPAGSSGSVDESAPPPYYQWHRLQEAFADYGFNNGLKIVYLIVACLALLGRMSNSRWMPDMPDIGSASSMVLASIVNIVATIWYVYDRRAFIPVVILQVCAIMSVVLFQTGAGFATIAGFGLMNMIVYYAIFHFDGMTIIDPAGENVKPQEMDLSPGVG